jgi:hypothetical protein
MQRAPCRHAGIGTRKKNRKNSHQERDRTLNVMPQASPH